MSCVELNLATLLLYSGLHDLKLQARTLNYLDVVLQSFVTNSQRSFPEDSFDGAYIYMKVNEAVNKVSLPKDVYNFAS